MGKLAVQKYFAFMILILTVLMMIFTIVGLFGGDVFPGGNMARALLVYALPLLMAGNVILLVYWLILLALGRDAFHHPALLHPLLSDHL